MAKPSGAMCLACAKRTLRSRSGADQLAWEIEVFGLKLQDWLGVDRLRITPCLSVCPEAGIAVERRGKSIILNSSDIAKIREQFDPTRQLKLFGEEV